MTKIGLFRCPHNEGKCPLTSCFLSLQEQAQGFSRYDNPQLVGVFTLKDSIDENLALAKILKAKGVEVIHFVTCAFSHKDEGKTWYLGNGFYEDVDSVARKIVQETGIPCIKGTAHLPENYSVEIFE
jgi:predicted metal-binding protein